MSQEIFLLIVIFSMMAVTFAIRLIPLHLSPERTPRFINAVIEYIPAAVISSITIPALCFPQNAGSVYITPASSAALPVVFVARFTKNLIVSVVVGVICQVLASHFLLGNSPLRRTDKGSTLLMKRIACVACLDPKFSVHAHTFYVP